MPSAHALRTHIEASLSSRFAGALTPAPRTIREVASTGIEQIDAQLSGGLPIGAISEMVGPECSGRMTATLSFIAERNREGRVCAWVDVNDCFDPESAAANGVKLSQLLWVRCSDTKPDARSITSQALAQRMATTAASGPAKLKREQKISPVTRIQHGCAGQHPRNEVRGMDAAIEDLLHDSHTNQQPHRIRNQSKPNTPGAPNRKIETHASDPDKPDRRPLRPVTRNEQVSTDRHPGRSQYIVEHQASDCVTYCPACYEAAHDPRRSAHVRALDASAAACNPLPRFKPVKDARPWTRLDQALRATDLLLQAGGFSAIVLDIGSIGPEHAMRIPLATWFRFRQAADLSRSSLIVIAQTSCAKSSAAMVLRFEPMALFGTTVIESAGYETGASRQRFAPAPEPVFLNIGRKQPQSTWQSAMYSPADTSVPSKQNLYKPAATANYVARHSKG